MHELSIAVGIVDLAEKEAAKAGGTKIESIELVVGKLSGVEIDALNFVWASAVSGTILEEAKMLVTQPKGRARCMECGKEYELETIYENCDKCNSYLKEIFQGKELQVKSITIV
jgi:hydrogenase nickel incorporation protein HypA/HybF